MTRRHVVRAEMRLARRDVEPLRLVAPDPDPLVPFSNVLARVDAARGEHAEVVVDLLPATPRERLRFRRRQRDAEIAEFVNAAAGRSTARRDALRGDAPGTGLPLTVLRNPAAALIGSADAEQVSRKVAVPAALFYVQVLMRATSPERRRARATIDALIACWEQWAGRNWFELAGVNLLGMVFVGSNSPLRRWWFDYRLDTGRFGPTRRRLLGARDVAGLLQPPTSAAARATRASPQFTRPSATLLDTVQLNGHPGPVGDTAVLATAGGRLLFYGIGRRASPVEGIAAGLVARAVGGGAAILVLDADAIGGPWTAARPDAPLWSGDDGQPVAGWNPLLPPATGAPVDRGAVAVRALTSAVRTGRRDGSAAAVIGAAVDTLRTLVRFVPRRLAPTLLQIAPLVEDAEWRSALLPLLDAHTRRFWTDAFPDLDADVIDEVTDVVRRLREEPAAVALLGQVTTTYDPHASLVAGRRTVMSKGDEAIDDALAALLWFDASAAARATAGPENEAPPLLVATATHRYGDDRAGVFVDDLAATVRSGARAVLLTDAPDRVDRDVRGALRRLATMVAVDVVDTGMAAAAEWLGVADEGALRTALDALDRGECLVASARHGWRLRPLGARTGTPLWTEPAPGGSIRTAGGWSLRDTRARLDGLEARIAAHLTAPAAPARPADGRSDVPTVGEVVQLDRERLRRSPHTNGHDREV